MMSRLAGWFTTVEPSWLDLIDILIVAFLIYQLLQFIRGTHAIANEEYPGDQCYTCGWTQGYDVFIQARQHGGCTRETTHPCVVSEYGDWEYYAMTAGLDQEGFGGLTPAESNSRQLRWQGEKAQLQQAANFQEAHDGNLATAAFADGLWVMYDYNRGYSPDHESSGCADIFRLPKYAYHFFRSQRPATELLPNELSGAMVFIASEWAVAVTIVVEEFPTSDRGRALGIVTSMNTLGGITVGVLAFLGLQHSPLDWRGFFVVGIVPLIRGAAACRLLVCSSGSKPG